MAKVFGPSGVKGIDVQTPTGTRSYDADKSGLIEISNKADLKQAISEGMAIAGVASGFYAKPQDECPECNGVKFASQTICASCYTKELDSKE